MFQTFDTTSDPTQGPARLAQLRALMAARGLAGFFVPRADAHQGEYVVEADRRLAWLTGFTGSAGFCLALAERAGVFVDGRYRNQVRGQVDLAAFSPVAWPEVQPGPWLVEALPAGGTIGYDPWLMTRAELDKIEAALAGSPLRLAPVENLVDRLWTDRPTPPAGQIVPQPVDYAGQSHAEKRAALGAALTQAGAAAAVLTLTDSIAWLLNIRGNDIAHVPVVQAFAILHASGRVDLFTHPARPAGIGDHLGPEVRLYPTAAFTPALATLAGPVRLDRQSAPLAVAQALEAAGVEIQWGDDPCILPKAQKNAAELAGTREAHLIDAAAMVEFLAWYQATEPGGGLTEIDLVTKLESARRASNQLKDISFETIAGSGPNGAIMHYRVTHGTNRALVPGELVVLDSGGQYPGGTTDITRTLAVGAPEAVSHEARAAFTRVLQGMIAVSRLVWPRGRAGRDLDAVARYPLWLAHQDYNHGTGHGVGAYLSVHEGPARLNHINDVPLLPGMILSNEPGYYRDGAFGIRLENLVAVREAPLPPGGDADRAMLAFETLTFVPIERGLILAEMLAPGERAWLDAYHAEVLAKVGARVSPEARAWLTKACAPL